MPHRRAGRPRRLLTLLLLPAGLLALSAGCKSSGGGDRMRPEATPAPAPTASAAKAPDRGDFKVARRAGGRPKDEAERRELEDEEKSLEEVAESLNGLLSLPHDILIGFEECGEPNAFYDPEQKRITVCDELTEDLYEAFRANYKDEQELEDVVGNATTFVFYHELGHALVDVFDLPVTGREEDAADQLSVMLLADGSDEGEQMVLDGARSFARETDEKLDELAFADEHSLDRQRFYNIICLLYGQNEQKYASLVEDGSLPEGRAARCRDEFTRADKAWDTLLAPYLK